jgi:hypothetical protein
MGPDMATATPPARRAQPPHKQHAGLPGLDAQPSAGIRSPSERGAEGLCRGAASSHSGHLRGNRAPDQEPGRIDPRRPSSRGSGASERANSGSARHCEISRTRSYAHGSGGRRVVPRQRHYPGAARVVWPSLPASRRSPYAPRSGHRPGLAAESGLRRLPATRTGAIVMTATTRTGLAGCRVRAGLHREGNAGRQPASTLIAWPRSRPRRSSRPAQRRRWR